MAHNKKYPRLESTLSQARETAHALWQGTGHISQNHQHLVRAPQEHQPETGMIVHVFHHKTRGLQEGNPSWQYGTRKMVFYPEEAHAEKFATSAGKDHLIADNPGHTFPGAVGYLLGIVPQHPNEHTAEIDELRGCYNRSKTRRTITRSISYKYDDWREHLLRHFFKSMDLQQVKQVELHRTTRRGNTHADVFTEIASEFGFSISKEKSTERKMVAVRVL
jgi:hypothetical protein